jgi:hypothetical protein
MSELRTPLERMQLVFAKFPIHKNLLSKFKNAKKSNNTKIEYPFSAHRSSHYLQMPPYPKFSKKSAPYTTGLSSTVNRSIRHQK